MANSTSAPAARPSARWRYIAIYYAIACAFSWLIWAPLYLGQRGLKLLPFNPFLPVVICIGTLGPLLGAYIAHRLETGNWRAAKLIPRQKLRLLWLLGGPILILFCFFVVFPALISKGAPADWHWHPNVLAGILVPMFNYNLFGGPLFEEFGWRAFLLPRVQSMLPPWIAAIVVGMMWAAWHLPILIVPVITSASIPDYFLDVIGLSLVMTFAFNASQQCVAVAIVMHSAFNASSRFIAGYLGNTPTREHPSPELLIAFAFLLVGFVLIVITHGRMALGDSMITPSVENASTKGELRRRC